MELYHFNVKKFETSLVFFGRIFTPPFDGLKHHFQKIDFKIFEFFGLFAYNLGLEQPRDLYEVSIAAYRSLEF